MRVMGYWNNKGGTGKTSLAFQSVCAFAAKNPDNKILVVDVCPQANLSELLLGGQENNGGTHLLTLHGKAGRCSIGATSKPDYPSLTTTHTSLRIASSRRLTNSTAKYHAT